MEYAALQQPVKPARLAFVSGTRCLASLWIVCQHFLPHSADGVLVKALWRSTVAVDYFIVLSGFVTHWAARGTFVGARAGGSWRVEARRWYARRFGRALLATYLAMGASWALLAAGGGDVAPGHVVRCALLAEPWLAPARWCPDGQTWTVAALAPSWLLYPLAWDRLAFRRRFGALALLAVALAVAPTAAEALLARGAWPTPAFLGSPHRALYLWPPGQLADFGLGVCAAEAASRFRGGVEDRRRHGRLADAAAVGVSALVLLAPNPSLAYRSGYEVLFDHGLAPLLALFLYAAAVDAGRASAAAAAFSHGAPDALGACSFQVYLFQWPLHALFAGLGLDTKAGGEVFVAYALALYASAAAYERNVERPYVAWLRHRFPGPDRPRAGVGVAAV